MREDPPFLIGFSGNENSDFYKSPVQGEYPVW